jgi:hypothetical protein
VAEEWRATWGGGLRLIYSYRVPAVGRRVILQSALFQPTTIMYLSLFPRDLELEAFVTLSLRLPS